MNMKLIDYITKIVFDSGMDYSVRPGTKSMPVYMNDVRCSGRELSLLECGFRRNSSTSDHSKDIAVKCKKGTKFRLIH